MAAAIDTLDVVLAQLSTWGLGHSALGRVGDYNQRVPWSARLDDLGDPRHLVAVIANSKDLWPRFLEDVAHAPLTANPVDDYVERAAESIRSRLPAEAIIRFGHRGDPGFLSMQTLARVTGLAALGPCHLSVHPDLGPWLALRLAIVVPVLGPASEPATEPCASCSAPCMAAFDAAVAAGDVPSTSPPAPSWRAWVAVRDACPMGRSHRYGDFQLRYHYTKDRSIISDALSIPDPGVET